MAYWSYKAATAGGVTEGVIEAPDERSAVEKIRNTGAIPIKVGLPAKGASLQSMSRAAQAQKTSRADLLTFTDQLVVLLGAGLPLDRSLSVLSEAAESRQMKSVIDSLLSHIREGSSFSEALERHPKVFPKLYISMVKAGEAGGVLDVVLAKVEEFLESMKDLRDSVISAMIYPVILLIAGGASIMVILTYVLPSFSIIFEEAGSSLPLHTALLIGFSAKLKSHWWAVLAGVAAFWLSLKSYGHTAEGGYRLDALRLKMSKNIVTKLETARFCKTLGILLKSGVPLMQALHNAREVVGNRVIARGVDAASRSVREGKSVAVALSEMKVLPAFAISMIRVGEETGQLDGMLLKVSATYEKDLRIAIKNFVGVLEPALILGMGVFVGFIVISMLTAIFSITELPM